jgi:two-component system chemotaxis sensor kinase CheA
MSIDLTRFYESFFIESLESLDASESGLLALEKEEPTPERLNAIFRGLHSIKGAAGSLGFTALADFTHHVEGVLDKLRQGRIEPDKTALDVLLGCVDFSRALVGAARDGRPVDGDRGRILIERLGELDSASKQWEVHVEPAPAEPEPALPSQTRFIIRFEPAIGFFQSGNDPLRLLKVLDGMGAMEVKADTSRIPSGAEFDAENCHLSWEIQLTTTSSRAEIEEVFAWVRDDCTLAIEEQAVAPPTAPAPERRREDRRQGDRRAGGRRAADTEVSDEVRSDRLHVSRDKVDDLINLVGELVITKTMLKQSVLGLDERTQSRLESVLNQLERNTRDMQDRVMSIRMLPVNHAFGRFSRLVRDVSQRLGKKVELVISGEQSELDKSVIEKLVDPLTHLVRNALDHGIEAPEQRVAVGKSEIATLKLHAEHKGGHIEIVVSDDGRGIDAAKVAAKGRTNGLLREDEDISLERACELIFEPGFSTSETINELSGRGVGLDVVRKNILALSGGIKVETVPGKGTAFVIRLPLTLAIIDGMTVTVGGDTYIVPMAFIAECLQPDPAALKTVAGRGMLIEMRGQYLPLLKLGELIESENAAEYANGLLLVLEADGNRIALLVDALVGQEQVVIKSLESNYRRVSYIAGATILGEGRVVLILDVGALVRAARD